MVEGVRECSGKRAAPVLAEAACRTGELLLCCCCMFFEAALTAGADVDAAAAVLRALAAMPPSELADVGATADCIVCGLQ